MSSYKSKAINPETGKEEEALFIDNYYGRHRYGIGFNKDRSGKIDILKDVNNCEFYREEEIKIINNK